MKIAERLFKPSSRITDISERDHAGLLSVLLLSRFAALIVVAAIVGDFGQGSVREVRAALAQIFAAAAIDLGAYLLSRTRFFRLSVWIVVVESVVGITLGVLSSPSDVSVASTAAWLILSTLICSLILPARQTAAVIGLTFAALVLMSFHVPPELHVAFGSSFLLTMLTSILALVGAVQRDRTEKRLESERGKVIHASKLTALGEMAGGIAHEINTPLAIIKLNAELMGDALKERTIDPQAFMIQLESVIRVTDRAAAIIKGLKALSRNSQAEPVTDVPVRALLEQTLIFCTEKFRMNGVSLEVAGEAGAPAVRGVETQLSQVLLNLLNNAYDAALGGTEKWVRIEIGARAGRAEIRVLDGGSGVPPGLRDRIFQPFFTTKEIGRGTGLGLSVSKSIMDHHGGSLTLDEASPNTCFVMSVPLAAAAALPAA